jgi:hypothetical protein
VIYADAGLLSTAARAIFLFLIANHVAVHESVVGPDRTSGEVRVESAKRGIADIASGLRPNRFMSTRP